MQEQQRRTKEIVLEIYDSLSGESGSAVRSYWYKVAWFRGTQDDWREFCDHLERRKRWITVPEHINHDMLLWNKDVPVSELIRLVLHYWQLFSTHPLQTPQEVYELISVCFDADCTLANVRKVCQVQRDLPINADDDLLRRLVQNVAEREKTQ